jgi:hypothetical protein
MYKVHKLALYKAFLYLEQLAYPYKGEVRLIA